MSTAKGLRLVGAVGDIGLKNLALLRYRGLEWPGLAKIAGHELVRTRGTLLGDATRRVDPEFTAAAIDRKYPLRRMGLWVGVVYCKDLRLARAATGEKHPGNLVGWPKDDLR